MRSYSIARSRPSWRRHVMLALAVFTAGLGAVAVAPASVSADAQPVEVGGTDCPHLTDSITRLYSAYFLRAPEAGGFDYWVGEFSSGARGLQGMSDFFSTSDEFRALYANLSNAEFVDLVYRNVLGRPSEPVGAQFWTEQLDTGAMSRGTVMINFSESPEFVARTGTAVPLAGYFSWYPEGAGFTCGSGSLSVDVVASDDALDVLLIHDPSVSSATGFAALYDHVSGSPLLRTTDYVPFGHISGWTFDADLLSTEFVELATDPQLSAYLVSYPGSIASFETRGGWTTDERSQPTTAELFREMRDAEFASDVFWIAEWPKISSVPYSPPASRGFYDGTRPSLNLTCNGFALPAYNAVYCPIEHYVAYDINLFSEAYRFDGDGFVYVVVAHEWAHAIQAQLPARLVSPAHELQADCLAGATLFGSGVSALTVDVEGNVVFEPGDLEELFETFVQLDGIPWIDGGSHGSTEERFDAFLDGADFGVNACFAEPL